METIPIRILAPAFVRRCLELSLPLLIGVVISPSEAQATLLCSHEHTGEDGPGVVSAGRRDDLAEGIGKGGR